MTDVQTLRRLRDSYDVGTEGYNALTEAIAEISKPIVIIESPYKATGDELQRNVRYVRACLRDSLKRGEAPFASHALYTLPGVLKDNLPSDRKLGMEAGFAFYAAADKCVVYADLGISSGMKKGIDVATQQFGLSVEERKLPATVMSAVGHE